VCLLIFKQFVFTASLFLEQLAWQRGRRFLWKGMSCHSFLHAVRYGNIIIGVYPGGSGSTELFCVRPAGKAGAGSEEKRQRPVPVSVPREWRGVAGLAAAVGRQGKMRRWLR